MSGGESWATTLPSTNSTIEWTTLSGWTTTSICSGSRPNSQRASITSSALFIRVAESIEIFGPICQVGCRSASSGVTSASSRRDLPRNGPARGGQDHPADLLRPPAAQRLEDRRVLAVDRQDRRPPAAGQVHDQRAGDDQGLLVGQGDGLARLERRPGPSQPRGADDRGEDPVGLGSADHPVDRRRGPASTSTPVPAQLAVDARRRPRVGQGDEPRAGRRRACSTRRSTLEWAAEAEGPEPGAAVVLDHAQGAPADRAGRAQDHDVRGARPGMRSRNALRHRVGGPVGEGCGAIARDDYRNHAAPAASRPVVIGS